MNLHCRRPSTFLAGFLTIVAACVLLSPEEAFAKKSEAWLELGTHAQNPSGAPAMFALSPLASGYYHLADPVYAEATVGGIGTLTMSGDDQFELDDRDNVDIQFANPYLGIGYLTEFSGLELKITAGITVPLAIPGGAAAYTIAEGMRGGWDPWLWAPRRLAPVLGVEAHQGLQHDMQIGGEISTAAMAWFGDGSQDTIYVLQSSAQWSIDASDVVELGTRLRGVIGRSLGNMGDRGLQTAFELFGILEARDQIYQARLVVPINDPYGFGFSSGGVWGLHVGAGMQF